MGSSNATSSTAAKRSVDINEYFVEGNTILSDAEIEQSVYPFLGPGKTLDDVELARGALQKTYEKKGFKTVFVEIPQQNVVGGRVVLAVTQAPVGKIDVDHAKHVSNERLAAAFPALQPGKVPDLNRFTAELQSANGRSADRQITPELKAGVVPGTIDVALHVEDKLPLHGSLEVNNRFSRDTSPTRVQASLRYDDLWGLGHSISAFAAVAPKRPDDSQVYVLAYGLPLSDSLHLDVTGLISNSDVSTIGSTDVLGDGHSVTAALSKTLSGPDNLYQRVTLSVAYKDFLDVIRFGATTEDAATSRTPITYFPISLTYGASLTLPKTQVGLSGAMTFSFRGLGSDSLAFDNKRYNATGGFYYVRLGANAQRELPAGAQLFLNVDGQLASGPLVSNEEFSAGGAGSVRGYLQSEAIGDTGFGTTLELRTPSFARLGGKWVDELRAIGFVDSARVHVIDATPDQQANFSLIGVGAGLRARLLGHLSGDLDIAWPLRDAGGTKAGDPRLQFRVGAEF